MTSAQWQQIKDVFHAALEREPGERVAFLDEACAGDQSLRREVESLITAHEKEGGFIDEPAFKMAAGWLMGDETDALVGQQINYYKVLALLGTGGMGEVYVAEDKRLGRKIALKLLPASFTTDADRLHRFRQEARTASALNHPNILTIYEIGEQQGRHFIAAELIEGETLRQYLSHTRPGLDNTLHIILQIADALAAAHKAGIIHRDIKPENIMLRADGYVKVLDFGLAKLVEPQSFERDSQAPTRQRFNTSPGMVMGTISYMSPEQARGDEVDARTDIWSLGVVFYEMLSGRVPFEGTTTSHIIVNILEKEPPWAVLSTVETPAELEWILRKALRKDREERYQTARELLGDLRGLKQRLQFESELERTTQKEDHPLNTKGRDREAAGFLQEGVAQTEQIRAARSTASFKNLSSQIGWNNRGAALMLVALLLTIIGVVGAYKFFTRPVATLLETKPEAAATSLIKKTTQITFSQGLDRFPSLSPDGNSVAYSSDQNGSSEVYIKQLTSGGREIQLTTDGQQNFEPAWSPDGQRIAYYSYRRGGIWVVPAMGGSPKQLVEFGSRPAWSRDGTMIAFQSNAPDDLSGTGQNAMPPSTIWVIPSQGGQARQLTQAGNPPGGHGAPSWSPDGKQIVFDTSDFISNAIWTVSLEGGHLKKIVADGESAIYSPDGANIYYSFRGLWKVHISPTTGEPVGEPVQVTGTGGPTVLGNSTISADGKRIAYSLSTLSSNLWSVPLSLASNQATGPPTSFTRDTSKRQNLGRFSPDGRRIAFNKWREGTSADIWVMDADGKNPTQVTDNPTTDTQASWFPEGDKLAFLSDRDSNHLALWSIVLASGKEELLLDLGAGVEYANLSPDGKQVAFNSKKSGTINIWTTPIAGGEPKQLTFDNELIGFPSWSPDGQFLSFKIKRGDDSHIGIIPSSGGTPIQLTFDHGQSYAHSWSPDGNRIAFAGLRNGIWNIWWVTRDGKTQKQLTNNTKLNVFVRYPAWSPRGDKIVYEYAETTGNIWIVDLK